MISSSVLEMRLISSRHQLILTIILNNWVAHINWIRWLEYFFTIICWNYLELRLARHVHIRKEVKLARHRTLHCSILFFCLAHFRCFENDVALWASLLFLLTFTLEPFIYALRMEKVTAIWNTFDLLTFFERLHTNHTVIIIKFIKTLSVFHFFNLLQKVFHSLLFFFL